MALFALPQSGWRRTAVVNTIIVGTLAALLICLLALAASAGGSLFAAVIFFEGSCTQSTYLNLFLHLLLNIISTLVIASSNFFMQVLNAPTREEVDGAHVKNKWLEIGVPSIGNAFHVTRYKTLAWVLFNLSSIPIHLLSNSAVFETDYQGGEWWHTMASEAFLRGGEYYGPGAGLLTTGGYAFGTDREGSLIDLSYGLEIYYDVSNSMNAAHHDSQSIVSRRISATAATAATWSNISAKDCRVEYQTCQGRRQYHDLVMVLDVQGETEAAGNEGWILNDLYNMSGISIADSTNGTNYTTLWDKYIPVSKHNSLWYSGLCESQMIIGADARRYMAAAVPKRAWARTYLLFAVIIGVVMLCTTIALEAEPLSGESLFGHESSLQNGGLISSPFFTRGSMIIAIVTANLPQIVLTLGYFAFNTLFTRLQAEKEWNAFSIDYRPLRVTSPEGEQRSTYRLQLPYRYSVPLLVTSIMLHWLVSNTVYVSIIEGGFYSMEHSVGPNSYGISEDSFIGIGFSSSAILLVFFISLILMTIPVILSWRKFKEEMVIARANSMIISAACHVSLLLGSQCPGTPSRICTPSSISRRDDLEPIGKGGWADEVEMQDLLSLGADDKSASRSSFKNVVTVESRLEDDIVLEVMARRRLAQSKLKWGVVKMAPEFHYKFKGFQEDVGHLSFGVAEQDVAPPEEGRWYA